VSPLFAKYLNDVERFFFVVRASGFVLSPRDTEKVRGWYLKGVPMRVVMEGIIEGAKAHSYKSSPGEKLPHQLSFYSRYIGARVRAFNHLPVLPETTPEIDDEGECYVAQLTAEVRLLTMQEERMLEREVKQELLERLEELGERNCDESDEGDLHCELQLLDEDILALYHSRLTAEERESVALMCRERLGSERAMSARAAQGRRRALEAEILRERLNLMEMAQ